MSINNVSEITNFAPKLEEPFKAKELSPSVEGGMEDARKSQESTVELNKQQLTVLEGKSKVEEKLDLDNNKAQQQDSSIDVSAVNNAIDLINQKVMMKSTNLIFEFDDLGDPPIVKVVDKDNGEVIREIPPKEMQEIAKAMGEIADSIGSSSGILFDSKI